ncbi:unnamed protein product, partial [marine sediment metagenome]
VKSLSEPGECLLATSHSTDPQIVKMPLIQRADIIEVSAQIVRQSNGVSMAYNMPVFSTQSSQDDPGDVKRETEYNVQGTTDEREETEETPFLCNAIELREITNELIETKKETLSGLAKKIEVNKGQLYRFLRKGEIPSEVLHLALSRYVGEPETPKETKRNGNLLPFPGGKNS